MLQAVLVSNTSWAAASILASRNLALGMEEFLCPGPVSQHAPLPKQDVAPGKLMLSPTCRGKKSSRG